MSAGRSLPPRRGATGRGAHSAYEKIAKGLGWFSIGLGVAQIFAPRAICRALGKEGHETLVRAYGVREVATGLAILTSHDPTPWIWGRVGGDALDLATLATGFEGSHPKTDKLTAALVAVAGVTALDIYCAQGLTADKWLPPFGTFDYGDRVGFPKSPRAMRGAASDATPPAYRVPELLRPWTGDRTAAIRKQADSDVRRRLAGADSGARHGRPN